MRSSIALLFLLILGFSNIITFVSVHTESKTIVSPDDFATLGGAVEHAAEGDTIYVKQGRHEILNSGTLVINKSVSIIGRRRNHFPNWSRLRLCRH